MDEDITLRIRKSVQSPSRELIHERLYKESILCQKLANYNNTKPTPKKSEPVLRNGVKIEDSLIQSKQKSKAELLQLKKKYKSLEMKTLQKAPKINENSKILASRTTSTISDIKSPYIKSIISTSRSSRIINPKSKRQVKTAHICLDNLDLMSSCCKTPNAYRIIPTKDRSDYIKSLTSQFQKASKTSLSLLKMDPVTRNEYWVHLKAQNLEKIKKEVHDKAILECSFSPELLPRINISCITPPPKSLDSSSYMQLHSIRKSQNHSPIQSQNSPSPQRNYQSPSPHRSLEVPYYHSLSPHSKKVSYKAGMNLKKFMQVAKPMFRYISPKYLR